MSVTISSNFCGGNIDVLDASDASNIRLNIAKDKDSDFYQWFYFRVTAEAGQALRLVIENAAGAAYPRGWEKYKAVISYDLAQWSRVPAAYDGKHLTIETVLEQNSAYVAYFAPYPLERHARLIARAQAATFSRVSVLGQTLDGRDMDLVTIGEAGNGKKALWVIARQHPGETMAEWWMEGFLERLLDADCRASSWLRDRAVLYIVPNMNPDGSTRGHLRTNAAGVNLNREWQTPSMEKSPEVYLVLNKMRETGLDFALDVHGDEALPYNFIAGSEGIPGYTEQQQAQLDRFKAEYVAANADFQTRYGYPVNKPGKANLAICGNALAAEFDALAMTLEMPFKDNADRPDAQVGWSPERSKRLGADALDALVGVFDLL
ncbi:MAG: M14-type cytosolic carboxypeptidase [Henriciella sp.]